MQISDCFDLCTFNIFCITIVTFCSLLIFLLFFVIMLLPNFCGVMISHFCHLLFILCFLQIVSIFLWVLGVSFWSFCLLWSCVKLWWTCASVWPSQTCSCASLCDCFMSNYFFLASLCSHPVSLPNGFVEKHDDHMWLILAFFPVDCQFCISMSPHCLFGVILSLLMYAGCIKTYVQLALLNTQPQGNYEVTPEQSSSTLRCDST